MFGLLINPIHFKVMILRYVTAFGELAKSSTTMLLPGNPSDVGSAVAQAMSIYGKVATIFERPSDILPGGVVYSIGHGEGGGGERGGMTRGQSGRGSGAG